jgi:hypothetical protein
MAQTSRTLNGDWQRRRPCAATAFEQANDEFLALPFEGEAQRCWRGLTGTGRRAENEQQCATGLGSKLQATQ